MSDRFLTKTPKDSEVIKSELVLPNDTNVLGNLLGGRLMHWMDIAGALAAQRHSNHNVATVAIDSLNFTHPVRMGELVQLKAKLIWTGRTSMRVRVTCYAENLLSGSVIKTNEGFLTFVALDDDGNPAVVPKLIPETDEEKVDWERSEQNRHKC